MLVIKSIIAFFKGKKFGSFMATVCTGKTRVGEV
jgi:hypothetical protein